VVELGQDGRWHSVKLTRAQYYHGIGSRYRTAREAKRNAPLAAAYTALAAASAKTAELEQLRKHMAAVRAHFKVLWKEKLWLGHARERLRVHGAKKRVLDKFAERLLYRLDVDPSGMTRAQRKAYREDPANAPTKVLVAYGAAHFAPSGRGERAVPTTTAFKRVKRAFPHTDAVDEYATSKMCPTCRGKLTEVWARVDGLWREERGLRKCNNACGKFVNRDKEAARNMVVVDLAERNGKPRPAYLARNNALNEGSLPRVYLEPHEFQALVVLRQVAAAAPLQ
jgi:hypothetical protein